MFNYMLSQLPEPYPAGRDIAQLPGFFHRTVDFSRTEYGKAWWDIYFQICPRPTEPPRPASSPTTLPYLMTTDSEHELRLLTHFKAQQTKDVLWLTPEPPTEELSARLRCYLLSPTRDTHLSQDRWPITPASGTDHKAYTDLIRFLWLGYDWVVGAYTVPPFCLRLLRGPGTYAVDPIFDTAGNFVRWERP